jgi:hypothetical protein
MVNNGVEHVLRQLTNHWRNMLYQPFGNFAHQRMEQMSPFEMLRFHLPVILVVLSQLRGLCHWDATVLGPFVTRLQGLNGPQHSKTGKNDEVVTEIHAIVKEMKEKIMIPVCGGIASRIDLLRNFVDTIDISIDAMAEEAIGIKYDLERDEIRLGTLIAREVITNTVWKVPEKHVLDAVIRKVCLGQHLTSSEVSARPVRRALNLLAPKDKRTLIEMFKNNVEETKPGTLLWQRTRTLLRRELRRDALDKTIRERSKGKPVSEFTVNTLYWLTNKTKDDHGRIQEGLYAYKGAHSNQTHKFINFQTRGGRQRIERTVKLDEVEVCEYVKVAEDITVAQKAFMTIELDYGKKFSYSGFMEFIEIRDMMLQLMSVSQIQCESLDDARMNLLQLIQMEAGARLNIDLKCCEMGKTYFVRHRNGQYEPFEYNGTDDETQYQTLKGHRIYLVPPQNMLVTGGGPTGLLTAVHCLENVLLTGGNLRLYESRDAFLQAGATFERSQIVRLDARWIAMMRYHLGTIYEDVFVPAQGETDSHYGNSLPFQGFIEITIKDMENMLNIQVAKFLSRELLQHDTNSGAEYRFDQNELVKLGKALKEGDLILRQFDQQGQACDKSHGWKVSALIPPSPLPVNNLQLLEDYVLILPGKEEKTAYDFKLVGIQVETGQFFFRSLEPTKVDNYVAESGIKFPEIYRKGSKTEVIANCEYVIVESIVPKDDDMTAGTPPDGTTTMTEGETRVQEKLLYKDIASTSFLLDIGYCHVLMSTGKQLKHDHHFSFTTEEPYGVCCLSGLKVSMGMHNFGTRRWRHGLTDDIRSRTDQNTRVIGDFTKVVNSEKIVMKMIEVFSTSVDWRYHFENLAPDKGYDVDIVPNIHGLLLEHIRYFHRLAPYKRHHLQTRFFETGDIFYLGMELNREYDRWKEETVASLLEPATRALIKKQEIKKQENQDYPKAEKDADMRQISGLKTVFMHHIDRLWYFATLEVIREGDVYNPGGRGKVPHLYLIDHHVPVKLSTLDMLESFTVLEEPKERYELLATTDYGRTCVARNHEGIVKTFPCGTMVKLGGNLTRGPDGFHESKVCLSTFPVSHWINYRTMKLANSKRGYTFAFLGDEQSSPHFMRYSGLTGAAINAMAFNNFLHDAIEGVPFPNRFYLYAALTNWSNGEVVQRGTSSNYGVDGFLRPGFPYIEGVKYLWSKVVEHMESNQDMDEVLSRDWRTKFAAALVPRGMEYHESFLTALISKVRQTIFEHFLSMVEVDPMIKEKKIVDLSMVFKDTRMHCGSGKNTTNTRESSRVTNLKQHMRNKDSKNNNFYAAVDSNQAEDESFAHWKQFMEELSSNNAFPVEMLDCIEKHCTVAVYLEKTLDRVIEHAQQLRDNNSRVSTVADTQPKSVDSIIDIFAPEAQAFASVLAQASTFAALTLGLRLVTPQAAIVASAAAAFYAAGTSTNGSRYKNRHEEWRVYFYENRFDHILKQVYSCMNKSDRTDIPDAQNPFHILLEAKKNHFIDQVKYYDYPKPIEFLRHYETFIQHYHEPEHIESFLNLVEQKYLADVYHVNSYLQEKLVDLCLLLEEMLGVESNSEVLNISADASMAARCLFERLILFKPRLETSLQRGKVAVGSFRVSKWKHMIFVGIYHYFVFVFWRRFCHRATNVPTTIEASRKAAGGPWKPIIIEIKEILTQMKSVKIRLPETSTKYGRRFTINREIVDMKSLYYATHESYVASLLVTSGILNFFTGLVFFGSNLAVLVGANNPVSRGFSLAATFSFGIISPITAILAVYFYTRHFKNLVKCDYAVGNKEHNIRQKEHQSKDRSKQSPDQPPPKPDSKSETMSSLGSIRHVAHIQMTGITLRVIASLMAAVALPWSLAVALGQTGGNPRGRLPLFLAAGSAALQIFTALYLYLIEYTVLYRTTPKMGELCCGAFMDDILTLKDSFTIPQNMVQTRQSQEMEVWEYVAKAFLHKYRFDAIYAANRFGAILQYIHSGCVSSEEASTSATVEVAKTVEIPVNSDVQPLDTIQASRTGSDISLLPVNNKNNMSNKDFSNDTMNLPEIYYDSAEENIVDPSADLLPPHMNSSSSEMHHPMHSEMDQPHPPSMMMMTDASKHMMTKDDMMHKATPGTMDESKEGHMMMKTDDSSQMMMKDDMMHKAAPGTMMLEEGKEGEKMMTDDSNQMMHKTTPGAMEEGKEDPMMMMVPPESHRTPTVTHYPTAAIKKKPTRVVSELLEDDEKTDRSKQQP